MDLEKVKSPEGNSYEKYQSAGGIINKTDYANALAQAKDKKSIDSNSLAQVQVMARRAGIVLQDRGTEIDPRVALYAVLQADTNFLNSTPKERYLRDRDQFLFMEVLRMLGDTESLERFLKAHPHIFPEGK